MRTRAAKSPGPGAFTIVELLTVISVIAILIGILVPALRAVRESARKVNQKAQLHAIDAALEIYRNDTGDYPPSSWNDPTGAPYNGALKLAEAMVGQDLLGQHVDSVFRTDGLSMNGATDYYDTAVAGNLDSRLPVYLKLENANAYRASRIYSAQQLSDAGVSDWAGLPVLCDVFDRGNRENKIGMPVLYYRAHAQRKMHDPNDISEQFTHNIYDYRDNAYIVAQLTVPETGEDHPMGATTPVPGSSALLGVVRFYDQTRNRSVETRAWPYNAESFILLSAGPDGKYGTPDDIANFGY